MHGKLPKEELTRARKKRAGRGVRRALVWLIVLGAVGAALYYVYAPTKHQRQAQGGRHRFAASSGPVPVLVAPVKRADVPVYLDTVGTATALQTVTVRPQVDGKLISINFKEGQDVKKGEVLAHIDPTIYQAALDQAKAKKAQDEAQLANAKNDMVRYEKLAAINAINKQQADTQKALVAQYTALVQADQAAIENAQATVGYTTITAPISGRTGLLNVDPGNYVRASDASSSIVTISQIKPIAVLFNLPQQDLDRVNEAFAKGPLPVDAQRPSSGDVIAHGNLTVVDNAVDSSTGTVKLKAVFPNPNLQLWPGQFVNVRLLIDTLKNVVVVPTAAVQRGPNGAFVYTVGQDDKAVMHLVKVQRQDETQTVIASGLELSARVVTTGFVELTDGKQVKVGGGAGAPPRGKRPQGSTPESQAAPTVGAGQAAAAERKGRRGGGERYRPAQ
ncbi:MAG TPA: efflux RND transporter periplasmic adaptor subunit [Pseudolabrys sp.]|nr:efflux RND transporter periplasmic adaptor subunit [Pseudolabrys sp.]